MRSGGQNWFEYPTRAHSLQASERPETLLRNRLVTLGVVAALRSLGGEIAIVRAGVERLDELVDFWEPAAGSLRAPRDALLANDFRAAGPPRSVGLAQSLSAVGFGILRPILGRRRIRAALTIRDPARMRITNGLD